MALKYAKDQPTGFTNRIERVAIIGAGGHVGEAFTKALLNTGKHVITALTRQESKAVIPAGVKVAQVNYDDEASIVSALKSQQFLVISLSNKSPPDTHSKIVQAAAKAGVPYIMPNIYGYDIRNEALIKDSSHTEQSVQYCKEIEATGVSSYIAMICGFWYEWSVARPPPWFGFDIPNKKVTFFDDGETRINVSTWQLSAQALANLVSLKELPDDASDTSPAVSRWKNKPLYISSFKVSQRDTLDSLNRVMGTTDDNWEIDSETTAARFQEGKEELEKGIATGRAKVLYSRMFFPEGRDGDFEATRGLDNDALGLPKDDLDEATARTVEMIRSGWKP